MRVVLVFSSLVIICNILYSQVDSNEYLGKVFQCNKEIYLRKALLFYYGFSNKNKDTAIYYINKAINLDSTYADAYYLKATMFIYSMQDDSTLKYINKAITHNPGEAVYYKVRATAYTENYSEEPQNLVLAENDMNMAIRLILKNSIENDGSERKLSFYYFFRGYIRELREDWINCCKDYKEAVNLGMEIPGFKIDCNCKKYRNY